MIPSVCEGEKVLLFSFHEEENDDPITAVPSLVPPSALVVAPSCQEETKKKLLVTTWAGSAVDIECGAGKGFGKWEINACHGAAFLVELHPRFKARWELLGS